MDSQVDELAAFVLHGECRVGGRTVVIAGVRLELMLSSMVWVGVVGWQFWKSRLAGA